MAFRANHLLGIEPLSPDDIVTLLDLAEDYATRNRRGQTDRSVLAGLTQINMFFESSTRTQASFELAGKRLGADVMGMAMAATSIKKGETLIDTAHDAERDAAGSAGGATWVNRGRSNLLASKVQNCAVLNAGDGRHEHPTQALLDAL